MVERVCVECLKTNDALLAPLLRLKDNNCHIDESERVLKDAQKYSELVILYEKKGLHNKGSTFSLHHLLVFEVVDTWATFWLEMVNTC